MGWGDLLARDRRGFAPISIGQDGCLEIPLTDGRDHITGKPLGEKDPVYKGVCHGDYLEIFVVPTLEQNWCPCSKHEASVKNYLIFFKKKKVW